MLTREQMIGQAKAKKRTEWVEIPEWGGGVWVRAMEARERDAFEAANSRIVGTGKERRVEPALGNYRARLAVLAVCDEAGNRTFSDEDAAELGKGSAAALDRIAEAAHRINGIGPGAIEGAEKN